MLLLEDRRYYVYCLLNPMKPGVYTYYDTTFEYEPFYIGKGKGNRYKQHVLPRERKTNYLKNKAITNIERNGFEIISYKFLENLTEREALFFEHEYVVKIGRIELKEGFLTNLSDGGGNPSRKIMPEETRIKISIAHTGKIASPEHLDKLQKGKMLKKPEYEQARREKIRISLKNRDPEIQNRFVYNLLGKTRPPEIVEKIRQLALNRYATGKQKPIRGNLRKWRAIFNDGRIEYIDDFIKWCADNKINNTKRVREGRGNRQFKLEKVL